MPSRSLNQTLKLDARLGQTLTPRMQFAVRLLQMSSLDYEHELNELAARNPFLDLEPGTGDGGDMGGGPDAGGDEGHAPSSASDLDRAGGDPAGDPAGETAAQAGAGDEPIGHGDDDAGDAGDALDPRETDPWLQSAVGNRNGASEGGLSAADRMVAENDLRAHLRGQAQLLRLSARDRTLLSALIESLDDDGYLRLPLDEIAQLAELDPAADADETRTALRCLQSLDPAGVGARSVGECLRLQLDAIAPAERALATEILETHLDRLARRDTLGLARLLGRPPEAIEALCAAIRRLDPRPGLRHGGSAIHYIVPDVVVWKQRGVWSVRLNADVVPRLALNQSYAELFQRHRGSAHREMAAHLQEARWTVRNVEQRFSTILAVAQSILKRQYAFFEHGPLAMKPLSLSEVATEIGAHESTVSRVTNNKYMATPNGVIELKSFFSRPMALASGGTASNVAIRELVREIIADERQDEALSDSDIAGRLARQGITITRRTVTKYRTLLQLPPAEQRRRARAAQKP